MSSQSPRNIVVGVDGSESSTAAAHWAAGEARRRGLSVHLVHTYWNTLAGPMPPSWNDPAQEYAKVILAAAEGELVKAFPGIEVITDLIHAHPITALRQLASSAVMTVLGANGHSEPSEVLLGSIASRAVSHLPGVVVLIRAGLNAVHGNGSVVVGVDGSTGSEAALGFAFEEAALRGVALSAVRVWDDRAYRASAWSHSMVASEEQVKQGEGVLLTEQLQPWRNKFPDVVVATSILHGRPATVILDQVRGTGQHRAPSLLVVGSRGHSGLIGRLIGSTSTSLIAEASCPVAVVHAEKS